MNRQGPKCMRQTQRYSSPPDLYHLLVYSAVCSKCQSCRLLDCPAVIAAKFPHRMDSLIFIIRATRSTVTIALLANNREADVPALLPRKQQKWFPISILSESYISFVTLNIPQLEQRHQPVRRKILLAANAIVNIKVKLPLSELFPVNIETDQMLQLKGIKTEQLLLIDVFRL